MPYENNPDNSPQEKKRKALEKRVDSIEEVLDKLRGIKTRMESGAAEYKEICTITEGLYKKAIILAEEDRIKSTKMPETDQEWEEWEARTRSIESIHGMIDNLLSDQEKIEQSMTALESEFDALTGST